MADAAASPDLIGLLSSLPPPLQGVAIFAVFVGATFLLGRRFFKRLLEDQPEPKVLAVGDPTTFTDMGPVKRLIEQIDVLTIQEQRNEAAIGSLIGVFTETSVTGAQVLTKLTEIADIAGQLLIDMRLEREQRESDELAQKYREEGRAEGRAAALEEARRKGTSARRRRTPPTT